MDGSLVSALSPLAECTRMKELDIEGSLITDISILSLMPLLESVKFYKEPGDPSITDLSPLLQCQKIRVLHVCGNIDLKDLTVLSNFSTLRTLDITETQIQDLTPLAGLPKLSCLFCTHIPTNTSLLPLERCNKLREIHCHDNAKDLDLLQQRRPDIMFHTARPSFALGAPAMIHLIGVVQSRIHAMTVAQAANPALLGVPTIQALVAIGPQLQDFVDQLQAQVSMIGLAPQSHALLQQIQLIEAQFQAYFADEQAQQQLLEAEAQGQGQAQAQEAEQNENQGEQHEEQLQGELEKLTLFRH